MAKIWLLYALLTVVALALVEAIALHFIRRDYDWKAWAVSMACTVMRTTVNVIVPISLAAPVLEWAWQHRLTTIALNGWLAFALLFIGQEFCYYWFHRASHRVRWFWASHAVHHTPNQLTLAAALRLGSFSRLIGVGLFFVPLVWLGFPKEAVLATLSINLLYQFWIHATWIPKLGWLEYLLNTPSAHRVHHAANLEYLDANYGGVLIVFDRLFGTYIPERERVEIRYGLVQPVTSYNPLAVEFVEWRKLGRDLRAARCLRAVLGHLLMPPGWRPDGQHETTEALRAQSNAQSGAQALTPLPSQPALPALRP
jgi:sterol desaturase/sphingolipid hydroxylase (fatty acid hydroxylase superfamily)